MKIGRRWKGHCYACSNSTDKRRSANVPTSVKRRLGKRRITKQSGTDEQ